MDINDNLSLDFGIYRNYIIAESIMDKFNNIRYIFKFSNKTGCWVESCSAQCPDGSRLWKFVQLTFGADGYEIAQKDIITGNGNTMLNMLRTLYSIDKLNRNNTTTQPKQTIYAVFYHENIDRFIIQTKNFEQSDRNNIGTTAFFTLEEAERVVDKLNNE